MVSVLAEMTPAGISYFKVIPSGAEELNPNFALYFSKPFERTIFTSIVFVSPGLISMASADSSSANYDLLCPISASGVVSKPTITSTSNFFIAVKFFQSKRKRDGHGLKNLLFEANRLDCVVS